MKMETFGGDLLLISRAIETGLHAKADRLFYRALSNSNEAFRMIIPLVCHLNVVIEDRLNVKKSPTKKRLAEFREWISKPGCITCNDIEDYIHFGIIEESPQTEAELASLHSECKSKIPAIINEEIRRLGIYPEEMSAVNHIFKISYPCNVSEYPSHLYWEEENCIEGKVFADTVELIVAQRTFFRKIKAI